MIELKGKGGGILQLEVNYTNGAEYTFYYKNNDIFFMCKDDDDGRNIMTFILDLEDLLEKNPNSSITQKLHQEPDSWLTTQLKKIFPSWSTKTPKPLIKETEYSSCSFNFIYTGASLECKRIENSSDYIIDFKFFDPYSTHDIGEDILIFKGSLLVSEEELLNFYRCLSSR